MAGIYVHIPFCRQKCHYCNFFSVASLKYKQHLLDALLEEIFLRRSYLAGKEIQSLYFGGGTPSLLEPSEIGRISDGIRKYYSVSKDAEITLEANPDDLDKERIREYMNLGINRMSIGVQSFHDADLDYLNRVHSASQAMNSITDVQDAGFTNVSIDLIYGIPGLTTEQWEENLGIAFKTGVQHISAYALTVEPKTALDLLIKKKKLPPPLEENIVEHFRIMMLKMKENGFIHYEISNFCREGFFSRHNSMYWNGEHYLGLGPSAHSYNGISRQWNISGIIDYMDQIKRGDRYFETEILTPTQHYNEYVMTSLRTMWGCDLHKIEKEFGDKFASRFLSLVPRFLISGHVIEKQGIYYLSDEGKLFADGIASDLFMDLA
jgi:oxygen-independent coproporphyrinogen III oxidase